MAGLHGTGVSRTDSNASSHSSDSTVRTVNDKSDIIHSPVPATGFEYYGNRSMATAAAVYAAKRSVSAGNDGGTMVQSPKQGKDTLLSRNKIFNKSNRFGLGGKNSASHNVSYDTHEHDSGPARSSSGNSSSHFSRTPTVPPTSSPSPDLSPGAVAAVASYRHHILGGSPRRDSSTGLGILADKASTRLQKTISGTGNNSQASSFSLKLPKSLSNMDMKGTNKEMSIDGETLNEDLWQSIQQKTLTLFHGEGLRTPIEELNKMVVKHLHACVLDNSVEMMILAIHNLLDTGMKSLDVNSTLSDEKLLDRLVEVWIFFYSAILPYIQGIFLPLEITSQVEIDTRKLAIIAYRDVIVLPLRNRLQGKYNYFKTNSSHFFYTSTRNAY
jgi:hypothetical protein